MPFKSLLLLKLFVCVSCVHSMKIDFGTIGKFTYEVQKMDQQTARRMEGTNAIIRFAKVLECPAGAVFDVDTIVAIKLPKPNSRLLTTEVNAYNYVKSNTAEGFDGIAKFEGKGTVTMISNTERGAWLIDSEFLIMSVFVFEKFEQSLQTRMECSPGRFLPLAELSSISARIFEILQVFQSIEFVLADIKPDNFLVDSKGRVVFADLEIAGFEKTIAKAGGDFAFMSWGLIADIANKTRRSPTHDDAKEGAVFTIAYLGSKFLPWIEESNTLVQMMIGSANSMKLNNATMKTQESTALKALCDKKKSFNLDHEQYDVLGTDLKAKLTEKLLEVRGS